MVKETHQLKGDQRDNKGVVRWGIGAVALLIVAVLIFNTFFRSVDGASAKSADTQQSTPNPVGNPGTK
jgi:hypothetical protein